MFSVEYRNQFFLYCLDLDVMPFKELVQKLNRKVSSPRPDTKASNKVIASTSFRYPYLLANLL